MKNFWTLSKVLPWILIVCGAVGLLMSGVLMFNHIKILEDPTYTAGCDLNPVLSCGGVSKSEQAEIFGLPNPMIGLAVFPVLITTGVVMLARVRLPRWYWVGFLAILTVSVGFVHWLFFQSVYRIEALCPYCMTVWVVTITSFWYVLMFVMREKYLSLPKQMLKLGNFIQRHHIDILLVWLIVLIALILKHFWYYYGPIFGL